jgi:hypothetical protein
LTALKLSRSQYKMVHRRRTHRKRGGEIVTSPEAENKFLEEDAYKRRKSLDTLGDRVRAKPAIVEGVGKETRTPIVSTRQEHVTSRARSETAGRRRHKRKHTRRRR